MKKKMIKLTALILALAMCVGMVSAMADEIVPEQDAEGILLLSEDAAAEEEMTADEVILQEEPSVLEEPEPVAAWVVINGAEGGYAYVDGYYYDTEVQAEADTWVKILIEAEAGYQIIGSKVTYADNTVYYEEPYGVAEFSFLMPEADVYVSVAFEAVEPETVPETIPVMEDEPQPETVLVMEEPEPEPIQPVEEPEQETFEIIEPETATPEVAAEQFTEVASEEQEPEVTSVIEAEDPSEDSFEVPAEETTEEPGIDETDAMDEDLTEDSAEEAEDVLGLQGTGGITRSQAVAWANAQIGQSLDYDGVYGAQCVDLTKYYYSYLGQTVPTGNANQYANGGLFTPYGWSYQGSPQAGDIAVWTGGDYGHVGIVVSVTSTQFVCVEQNYAGRSYCSSVPRNRATDDVNTFIRPDFAAESSSVSVNFSAWSNDNYTYIYNTDASIGQQIDVSGGSVSAFGFYLYNYNSSSTLAHADSAGSDFYYRVYYKINEECYYTLEPGTKYTYRFYVTVNGTRYWSSYGSFTTGGTHTHKYTSRITKEPTTTSTGIRTYTCSTCGNTYTETIPKVAETTQDLSTATVTLGYTSTTYSGTAKTPGVTVVYGGKTLTKGTDYTVAYSNNVNAGTASVSITGKGSYTGTRKVSFTITKKAVTPTVSLSATSYTYDGTAKKPTVTVKDGTTTLSSANYTVTYSNNVNPGTASVTVTLKGNYSGSRTVTFKINRVGWQTINGSKYYYSSTGKKLTGWQKISGKWYCFSSTGVFQSNLTGLVNTTFDGVTAWYYIKNGVYTKATGIAQRADGSNTTWYFVKNGVYTKATGIAQYADGSSTAWYYVLNGKYTKASGLAQRADGSNTAWYYVLNGKYTKASGLAQRADGSNTTWYYVLNGKYTKATGLAKRADGSSTTWYYVRNGVYTKTSCAAKRADGANNKVYLVINGKYTKQSGWKKFDGLWYYFTNGTAKTGWFKYDGAWYYLNGNGDMNTGWLTNGGYKYYMTSDGVMVTGWKKIGGLWYYFKSSGEMQTGWLKYNGAWYYLNKNGDMKTGWLTNGGYKYYMNASGIMQTGWKEISGKWYYFKSSGIMVTGTQTIGGKTYYFASNGVWQNGTPSNSAIDKEARAAFKKAHEAGIITSGFFVSHMDINGDGITEMIEPWSKTLYYYDNGIIKSISGNWQGTTYNIYPGKQVLSITDGNNSIMYYRFDGKNLTALCRRSNGIYYVNGSSTNSNSYNQYVNSLIGGQQEGVVSSFAGFTEASWEKFAQTRNGYGGKDVTWELDNKGVLKLTGTGTTDNNSMADLIPQWAAHIDEIKSIRLGYGIKGIGFGSFMLCSMCSSIVIPVTVTKIEVRAFSGCTGLKDVYYAGTQAQWNQITIETDNSELLNATIHYNSSGN